VLAGTGNAYFAAVDIVGLLVQNLGLQR
jgi:hypothetical protein